MAFSFEISRLFKLFSKRLNFKKLEKGQSNESSEEFFLKVPQCPSPALATSEAIRSSFKDLSQYVQY